MKEQDLNCNSAVTCALYNSIASQLKECPEAYAKLWSEATSGSLLAKGFICVLMFRDKFHDIVPTDKREAKREGLKVISWLRKQSDEDNMYTMTLLGDFLWHGIVGDSNYAEAAEWYRKAADKGDVRAQYNMGICYDYGYGITANKATAVEWYRKAADQGDTMAQFVLGVCYFRGIGVTENKIKAVEWYHKAAERGYARAQFNVGNAYRHGIGVTENKAVAVEWYRKAAEQGNANAQFTLGRIYQIGDGAMKSEVDSELYYCLATKGDRHRHLREVLVFSGEKRKNLVKLVKEQNWLNRQDFLMFLYFYTYYRPNYRYICDSRVDPRRRMSGDVKCQVFSIHGLSRLISSFL